MQNVFPKSTNPGTIALAIAATAVTGATIFYGASQLGLTQPEVPIPPTQTKPIARKITALGRLEPQGEVIRLSAPTTLQNDRVHRLLVEEGSQVEAGEAIAILDSHDRLQAALEQAEEEVGVARARLEQVQAGAKLGEIAAQEATISRIQAQWEGDQAAQEATISRIQAQWEGDQAAQEATISRIQAQWSGDRATQEATIRRLVAELENAEAEYRRYKQLYRDGAISRSLFDSKGLSVETNRQQLIEAQAGLSRINSTAREQLAEAQATRNRINGTLSQQLTEAEVTLNRINSTAWEQLAEAQATRDRIAEVRPVDVQVAQAEVNRAIAAVTQAQADLEQTYIKAPVAGQILKIHAYPGEKLDDDGIVELGQTSQMLVVAEVYQSDINEVRMGQPAMVTSQAFSGKLRGEVSHIGLQVERQNVFSDQPGENFDRKVVEVKIRLNPDDSQGVAGLTNLQVQVAIEPSSIKN